MIKNVIDTSVVYLANKRSFSCKTRRETSCTTQLLASLSDCLMSLTIG